MCRAVAGIAIGAVALQSMGALSLQELPRSQDVRLDTIVAMYTFAAAIAIGLVLGLIPVAATLSANVLGVLREEGRTATTGRGAQSLRRVLVVTQVGCAFLLLIGAGLLFASFRKVLEVDPGFTTRGVLTGAVSLPNARYADAEALGPLYEGGRAPRARVAWSKSGRCDRQPAAGEQCQRFRYFCGGISGKAGRITAGARRGASLRRYFEAIGVKLVAVASSPNAMPRAPRAPSSWTTAWLGASGQSRIRSAAACIVRATKPATHLRLLTRRNFSPSSALSAR